ncbi:MAG: fibronectin type III domain-containing protein [Acidimicrobiales bacterium]
MVIRRGGRSATALAAVVSLVNIGLVAGSPTPSAAASAPSAPSVFLCSTAAAGYVVPAGTTALIVDAAGASGSASAFFVSGIWPGLGGAGGVVHAQIPVVAGQLLTVKVGCGGNFTWYGGWPDGGFGGQGSTGGSCCGGGSYAGGGGGASWILNGATPLVVAAGGGGGGGGGSYTDTTSGYQSAGVTTTGGSGGSASGYLLSPGPSGLDGSEGSAEPGYWPGGRGGGGSTGNDGGGGGGAGENEPGGTNGGYARGGTGGSTAGVNTGSGGGGGGGGYYGGGGGGGGYYGGLGGGGGGGGAGASYATPSASDVVYANQEAPAALPENLNLAQSDPWASTNNGFVTLTPVPNPPPPPSAWTVTLTSSTPIAAPGAPVTLTAAANQNLSGTGYVIEIADLTSGALVASCSSGSTCSTSVTQPSAAAHLFEAYVSSPGGPTPPQNPQAASNPTVVTWASTSVPPAPGTPWGVVLRADQPTTTANSTVTLTALADQSVNGTGYDIELFDQTTGVFLNACSSGSSCTTGVSQATTTTHTYVAYVSSYGTSAPPPGVQATSNPVPVVWVVPGTTPPPTPWAVEIAADPPATTAGSAVTVMAETDQSVSGSGYDIELFDQTSGVFLNACSSGTSCTATVSQATTTTHTYVAYVSAYGTSLPPPNVQATSNQAPVAWASTSTSSYTPSAPTNAHAAPANMSAAVTWTQPSSTGGGPITSYTVTASPGGQSATAAGTATSATVTGLTNGTSYTFTVYATNAAGNSPSSSPSNAVTPYGLPAAPTNVSASPGNARATVSWSPASNNGSTITSYTVTSSGGQTATACGGCTSATVTGLTNGVTYTFTVTATNAAGTGAPSQPSNAVTPTAPATAPGSPTNVTASAGNAQATVSWTPPSSNGGSAITSYSVMSSGGQTASACGTCTSATMTGLTNGVAYTFTVTATNAAGTSAPSQPSNAVTPYGPPGAPLNVSASTGDQTAYITWTAPPSNGGSPIDLYDVQAYTSTFYAGDITTCGSCTSMTYTGLTNGTTYSFAVYAHNAAGYSPAAWSNTVTPGLGAAPGQTTTANCPGGGLFGPNPNSTKCNNGAFAVIHGDNMLGIYTHATVAQLDVPTTCGAQWTNSFTCGDDSNITGGNVRPVQISIVWPDMARMNHDFMGVGYTAGCFSAARNPDSTYPDHCTGIAPNGGVYKRLYVDKNYGNYYTASYFAGVSVGDTIELQIWPAQNSTNEWQGLVKDDNSGQGGSVTTGPTEAPTSGDSRYGGVDGVGAEAADAGTTALDLTEQSYSNMQDLRNGGGVPWPNVTSWDSAAATGNCTIASTNTNGYQIQTGGTC